MTNSEFTNFYIELGFNIIKTPSLNWIINKEGYAHSFPTLEMVSPTFIDFEEVFKTNSSFLLFRTNLDECNTFEYLFEGTSYDLEQFDSKIRNQIKKGLKSCEVRDADPASLFKKGLIINRQTLGRQHRSLAYLDDSESWKNYISRFFDKPDIYLKAAYVEKELAGYMIVIKVNDTFIIQHPFRDEKFSSSNPMNALMYNFINDIIAKERKINITYGLASFDDKPGLDKFKKGMLFKEVPATRLAVVSPKYKVLFNRPFKALINSVARYKWLNSNKLNVYLYLSNAYYLYKKHYTVHK